MPLIDERERRCGVRDMYIMEYYSAIKKNKIRSFVVMWMDLESVIQSEVRKRKTNIILSTHVCGI